MKVLHVDSAREWRGGQTQLLHLIDGSADALVLPRCASLRAAWTGRTYDYGPIGLAKALWAERPDVIAAHTSRAHGLAVLQRRVPVVVHRRVDFAPRRTSAPKYRAARGFVAVSGAVAGVLEDSGIRRDQIAVVHDGIEPRVGTPLPRPAADLVLAVGALVDHKDHVSLIRAAAIGGFAVWIAGEGPLRGRLEREIARSGASVTLLGQREDVPDLLQTVDVFCHPSKLEGLGQVVLEARAAGCPIVATRAGGVPEAVGADGVLVPPRDPAALARAIRAVLDAAVARRPRALPARFRADTLRDRTVTAYHRLLGI